MNNWNALRDHYKAMAPALKVTPANQFAADPYAWDRGGMMLFTPIEEWLWQDIRALDMVLYPQFPVGRFFVDFANPAAKVAIECDGKAFHQDKAKDAARDLELVSFGWMVYRLTGSECRQEFDEDSRQESYPKQFLRRIATTHGLLAGGEAKTYKSKSLV